MNRILSTAGVEFRIALRNRWVAIAVALMVVFALVLAAAGAAPTGDIGADRLSVIVASLTSLSVYLVPLIALLMSFDAIAGEVERGTLPLLLTYPVSRPEVLAGKLLAHLAILTLAVAAGYGAAAMAAFWMDPASAAGLLESTRGTGGGFRLSRPPASISLAEIIEAVEGPIAMTNCITGSVHDCALEGSCRVKPHLNAANDAVRGALAAV